MVVDFGQLVCLKESGDCNLSPLENRTYRSWGIGAKFIAIMQVCYWPVFFIIVNFWALVECATISCYSRISYELLSYVPSTHKKNLNLPYTCELSV